MSAYTLWCGQHSDVGTVASRLAAETPGARARRHRNLIALARRIGRQAAMAVRPKRKADDFGTAEDWMHHTGEYDYTQLPGF